LENESSTDTIQGLLTLISTKETSTEKQETLAHLVRKALPSAKYFSAGSVDIAKYPHASLGASIYTMFTEPMRNYASVHVQRQLSAALKGEEQDSDNFDVIDKIARHCNSSQLSKIAAEKDSNKLYTAAYIYRQCLNDGVKKMTVESFAIAFDTDSVLLYLADFDLELTVVLNDMSTPGAQHVYDSNLNQMKLVWSKDDENAVTQIIQFLSKVHISIHVDMKVVRPLFEVELLPNDSNSM
jgi:protein SSD1